MNRERIADLIEMGIKEFHAGGLSSRESLAIADRIIAEEGKEQLSEANLTLLKNIPFQEVIRIVMNAVVGEKQPQQPKLPEKLPICGEITNADMYDKIHEIIDYLKARGE